MKQIIKIGVRGGKITSDKGGKKQYLGKADPPKHPKVVKAEPTGAPLAFEGAIQRFSDALRAFSGKIGGALLIHGLENGSVEATVEWPMMYGQREIAEARVALKESLDEHFGDRRNHGGLRVEVSDMEAHFTFSLDKTDKKKADGLRYGEWSGASRAFPNGWKQVVDLSKMSKIEWLLFDDKGNVARRGLGMKGGADPVAYYAKGDQWIKEGIDEGSVPSDLMDRDESVKPPKPEKPKKAPKPKQHGFPEELQARWPVGYKKPTWKPVSDTNALYADAILIDTNRASKQQYVTAIVDGDSSTWKVFRYGKDLREKLAEGSFKKGDTNAGVKAASEALVDSFERAGSEVRADILEEKLRRRLASQERRKEEASVAEPGTILEREVGGIPIKVRVEEGGKVTYIGNEELEGWRRGKKESIKTGRKFRSLTRFASILTRGAVSGPEFFGLTAGGTGAEAGEPATPSDGGARAAADIALKELATDFVVGGYEAWAKRKEMKPKDAEPNYSESMIRGWVDQHGKAPEGWDMLTRRERRTQVRRILRTLVREGVLETSIGIGEKGREARMYSPKTEG